MGAKAFAASAEKSADPKEPAAQEPQKDLSKGTAPNYRTVVRNSGRGDPQAKADRTNPGFVTAIDVAALEGARPVDDLPQLLHESAATTVRSLGGLGQFSAVSIRGSTSQQVAFFIDGVPLSSGMSGQVSPSELSLDGLDRVEIHRGYLPLALGSAIGGAIHLRSDHRCRGPSLRAGAGFGSFVAHSLHAAYKRRIRGFCVDARVALSGALGGFTFLDTRGTAQNPADDRIVKRLNNQYERVVSQVGFAGRRGRWRIRGREMLLWKRQGIPGPGHAQARSTGLDTLSARSLLNVQHPTLLGARGPLTWVSGIGIERRHYRDPQGEVGLGVDDERLLAADLYLSPRLGVPLWPQAHLDLLAEGRGELITVREEAAVSGVCIDATRRRLALAAGAQLEQRFGERLLLAATFRADALRSLFPVCGDSSETDPETDDRYNDVGLSPRIAGRLQLFGGLSLRASAGRYFRAPTLLELFGDRGYVIGNGQLVAEQGSNAEGGFVVERKHGQHRARAHVAGFWTRSENLIQWVQSGPVIRPMNLALATLRGLESSLHAEGWRQHLIIDASYTLLAATNHSEESFADGKRLPGRPLHQVFARASIGHRWRLRSVALWPRIAYSIESVAGTFLDTAERVAVPPRTLHGCGLSLVLAQRFHLGIEVRNLLDRRTTTWTPPVRGATPLTVPISDFIGYPLPGRSLWASFRVALDPGTTPRRQRQSAPS